MCFSTSTTIKRLGCVLMSLFACVLTFVLLTCAVTYGPTSVLVCVLPCIPTIALSPKKMFILHIYWHSILHSFWRSIRHIFWHSIWHIFLTSEISSDALSEYIPALYLALMMAFYILTLYPSFIPAFSVAYILTPYLACSLTFFLPIFWHSIWHSRWRLRSGAVIAIQQSRLRLIDAHCNLALVVESRRCPLRSSTLA